MLQVLKRRVVDSVQDQIACVSFFHSRFISGLGIVGVGDPYLGYLPRRNFYMSRCPTISSYEIFSLFFFFSFFSWGCWDY